MEPPHQELDAALAAVEVHLAAGDLGAAYARLCQVLAWPTGKRLAPAELPRAFALLARLADAQREEPLAEVAAQVVRDPDSPDHLYDLGYALVDAGAPTLAATVLWRCLALVGDSEEVVCELVAALERALAYGDAFAVLEAHPGLRAHSFTCRYLHAYNAAMTGDLAVARATLPTLVDARDADTPPAADARAMVATLADMLARAERVAGATPLDPLDLRGWQYVLTGTLVSHQSPHGFAEPMHGRYAYLQDSLPLIAFGLARLRALVAAYPVPCIYPAPGRSSEILALAAARILDLPVAPWPAVGIPAPGLVVIYDLEELDDDDVHRLIARRDGQIVFAHATPWTRDFPVAPDVTTLLYQMLVPPWGSPLQVDQGTGAVTSGPGDLREPAAIADEIVAAAPLDADDLAADQPERWAALVDRAWPPAVAADTHPTRTRAWAGGPVPSSRFA